MVRQKSEIEKNKGGPISVYNMRISIYCRLHDWFSDADPSQNGASIFALVVFFVLIAFYLGNMGQQVTVMQAQLFVFCNELNGSCLDCASTKVYYKINKKSEPHKHNNYL